MTNHLKELKKVANKLDVYDIAAVILGNPNFDIWSGSAKPEHHHYGKHGLVQHTLEVVRLCFSSKDVLGLTDDDIDDKELFLSALFHDIGKLHDYKPVRENVYDEWEAAEHKRVIHHISRSAIIWTQACSNNNFKYNRYFEPVLHNILSHHGCRAWGSPVMPKSRAAWLLHLSDSISARMNDCVKRDLLGV
jgi:3'-5' exoribonuclease